MAALLEAICNLSTASPPTLAGLQPSFIDALLAVSYKQPSQLLKEFLHAFEGSKGQGLAAGEDLRFQLTVLSAAVQILKKPGTNEGQLESVVKKVCLPLLLPGSPSSAHSQVARLVADIIASKAAWTFASSVLLPPALSALGITPYVVQQPPNSHSPDTEAPKERGTGSGPGSTTEEDNNESSSGFGQEAAQGEGRLRENSDSAESSLETESAEQSGERYEQYEDLTWSVGPIAACHLIACLTLEATKTARQAKQRGEGSSMDEITPGGGAGEEVQEYESDKTKDQNRDRANGAPAQNGAAGMAHEREVHFLALGFLKEVVKAVVAPTFGMLKRCSDGPLWRQATQTLLPPLLEAAMEVGWTGAEGHAGGEQDARSALQEELWECCRALLAMAAPQRREAYTLLTSFLGLLLPPAWDSEAEAQADLAHPRVTGGSGAYFDLRAEPEFWQCVKTGLVDPDSLTRKRALHILKHALPKAGERDDRHLSPRDHKGQKTAANEATGKPPGGTSSEASTENSELADSVLGLDEPGSPQESGAPRSSGPVDKKAMPSTNEKRAKGAKQEAGSSREESGLQGTDEARSQALRRSARWEAFILLLETLDEYGVHLAEAAWAPQIEILVPQFDAHDGATCLSLEAASPDGGPPSSVDVDFSWLAVLWSLGFGHKNPQVRRLVLQSFLSCTWGYRPYAAAVPLDFVLGPLARALDDPAHHRDFGVKGVYSSATAQAAVRFFAALSQAWPAKSRPLFLCQLASAVSAIAPGRCGFMTLVMCLEAAALAPSTAQGKGPGAQVAAPDKGDENSLGLQSSNEKATQQGQGPRPTAMSSLEVQLLEALRVLVDDTKRHFNPNYRAKVYGHILRTTVRSVRLTNVAVPAVALFVEGIPSDLLRPQELLNSTFNQWLRSEDDPRPQQVAHEDVEVVASGMGWLVKGLRKMLDEFLYGLPEDHGQASEEELEAWGGQARRWAKLLTVAVPPGVQLATFLQDVSGKLEAIWASSCSRLQVRQKALLLLRSLLEACPPRSALCSNGTAPPGGGAMGRGQVAQIGPGAAPEEAANARRDEAAAANGMGLESAELEGREAGQGGGEGEETAEEYLRQTLAVVVDRSLVHLTAHARQEAGIFRKDLGDISEALPGAVRGKLGGPSQRRLPASAAAAAISGVLAVRVAAESFLWLWQSGWSPGSEAADSSQAFLWEFAWSFVPVPGRPSGDRATEVQAEIQVAAYEALAPVCRALAACISPATLQRRAGELSLAGRLVEAECMVEELAVGVQRGVQRVLEGGALARSRRAIFECDKWRCLDVLVSLPQSATSARHLGSVDGVATSAVGEKAREAILEDAVDSLERVGEDHMLPLLRCLRSLLQCGTLQSAGRKNGPSGGTVQVMRAIVRAGWAAMVDANKRKVAPIAAFLSAILHPAVFGDPALHCDGGEEEGPLKWLLRRLIDQGARSPRTMRLTALHVSGLWLRHPDIAAMYIPELKTLSLHGADAVDEELDGEIGESQVAAGEYATLVQSAEPELAEIFTNSEMYARVSVAILMHQLALLAERACRSPDPALQARGAHAGSCGRSLLLTLLRATVEEKDLAKELYKKKSAIHRRKVRAWQMLAILSHFLDAATVGEVTPLLEKAIERNNMPSVRQFVEIYAVQVYLRFPRLVEEHLVPLLRQHNMKTQALSSYVLIAAHVVLHSSPLALQLDMLNQLVPVVLPTMISHHHNLRSFSQVLIYRVLSRFPTYSMGEAATPSEAARAFFDSRCLGALKEYLEGNHDCTRMRVSVDRYLDAFDPVAATTPWGMFVVGPEGEDDPSQTVEALPFECAPVAVFDRVAFFLKHARESLRGAMASESAYLDLEAAVERDRRSRSRVAGRGGAREGGGDGTDRREAATEGCGEEEDERGVAPGGAAAANWDFQKKILRSRIEGPKGGGGPPGAPGAGPGAALPPEDDADEELLIGTAASRACQLAALRGQRQGLIVVASLIGRIPNLAGLARTCEVFKAAALVVADASIVQDRQFQLISVTAERWIPLEEVPESGLAAYLARRKGDGYTLLGLEQTANSVPIHSYNFPQHTVLVLGREKEGIPVDIIQMLDACVEIPQLGLIRSLNVHVSGAIATWEYTRQHLAANRTES